MSCHIRKAVFYLLSCNISEILLMLMAAIVLTPPLHPIFNVVPFDAEHWLLAGGIGVLPLVAMEIWKAGFGKRPVSSPTSNRSS